MPHMRIEAPLLAALARMGGGDTAKILDELKARALLD